VVHYCRSSAGLTGHSGANKTCIKMATALAIVWVKQICSITIVGDSRICMFANMPSTKGVWYLVEMEDLRKSSRVLSVTGIDRLKWNIV